MSEPLTDAELREMEHGIELHDPDADFLTARDAARLLAEVRRLRALFPDPEGDADDIEWAGKMIEEWWSQVQPDHAAATHERLDRLAARLRQVRGGEG